METMKIDFTKLAPQINLKANSIFKTKDQIQLLLCEDNDTDTLESSIYKLTLT
jgi:hypothetical protein